MNKIILIGRLTADPELRYTPNGKAVCSFTLAVNRPYTGEGGERTADFIEIVVWNKPAENVAKYLVKGRQAAVEGLLQIQSYEKDGQRRWRTQVVANSVEFLGSSNDGNGQGYGHGNQGQNPQQNQQQQNQGWNQQQAPMQGIGEVPATEISFSDDDLPF